MPGPSRVPRKHPSSSLSISSHPTPPHTAPPHHVSLSSGTPHTFVTCGFFSSEKATDGSLHSEDWALNMEICDIINETEEG